MGTAVEDGRHVDLEADGSEASLAEADTALGVVSLEVLFRATHVAAALFPAEL